ncbi:DNA replication ATP-dependent helicase/nuclease DNA2 [Sitophilus oryzae]|uniref:DNA replication ATP-dependent helicase/nuclease n=1 Tax=Sitophilus oryzae TaxID=7048 RepID=A0A6J2Y1R3_SITOR|nr:DNA replication ATP-dependent helicase/nuclease DNA2 [Sitophilus oryzae]
MKKTAAKSKASHGCKKISSYFAVQSTKRVDIIKKVESKVVGDIIVLDSDDDSVDKLEIKQQSLNKRKYNGSSSISPPLKKVYCEEKSGLSMKDTNDSNCTKPSTSGINSSESGLMLKNIKDLLSTSALKTYNSIEEDLENCPDKEESNKFDVQAASLSKNIHILSTPEKQIKTVPSTSSKKSPNANSSKKNNGEKSSSKKTPKKIFTRSPSNLNEFNVEILKNFVRITPSKKGQSDSSGKKAQTKNETTPNKISNTTVFSPTGKVRGKLDFSSCEKKISTVSGPEIKLNNKENVDLINVDFDDSWDGDMFDNYNLDLSNLQHCKVVNVDRENFDVILTVKSTSSNEKAICRLRSIWIDTKLNIGDTVNISAKKTAENEWLLDNKNGLLVYDPDFLFSASSISNAIFCKRKLIFAERYRGYDPTNRFMIIGYMVHGLLQEVLVKNIYQLKDIEKCAEDILYQLNSIKDIYASGDKFEAIKEDFYFYIPKIREFLDKYIEGRTKFPAAPPKKGDWKGTISKIEDIEENIWCPDLGWKGKVDVTIKYGNKVMPLEVKTGRASVSVEHRGQVLLYILMMNKLGYKVSSGLLLYLKEGTLKEIPPTEAEKNGLMILRNEMAYYLSKRPKVTKDQGEQIFVEPHEIPEPINHKSCANCPYNVVCVAHARYFKEDLSRFPYLQSVADEVSDVITQVHVDYFMHWSSLLVLEMSNREDSKQMKDIYTLSPSERKKKGKCLINLKLVNVKPEPNGLYSHTFTDFSQENGFSEQNGNFLSSGIVDSSYIVASTESRPAVASGFVTELTVNSIVVTLERDLRKKYENQRFFLDSYESTSVLTSNMASLNLLLGTTEQANKLRHIIIDRPPPVFRPKIPKMVAQKAKPILKRLNRCQQRAVLKAIAAEEYLLIKGMPGTGKTATIVALIQLLVEMGKTVLITSHTHSAVDNVCLRLIKYGVKFMRLGNRGRINKNLADYAEDKYTEMCSTPEQLERVYNSVVSHFLRMFLEVFINDTLFFTRPPPVFRPKIPKMVAQKAKPILKRLNRCQQRAVLKAIAAEEYLLIKGMPGTGKTATIVALIQLLVEMGKTVLITSHTHSAVDNVCLRLIKYGIKFMRLGNRGRINKNLVDYTEDKYTEMCSTPEQLERVYNSVFTNFNFSFRELGMDESLFERLDSEESRISLNLNYRMNEPITALANALTYNGELLIATEEIAKASLNLPNIETVKQKYKGMSWILETLDTSLERAVQFIDTGPVWDLEHTVPWTQDGNGDKQEAEKLVNIYEAAIIFHLIQALLQGGVKAYQIGVIATYRAQVAQLSAILNHTNVEINTVDQYQGKDKNVVFYSCSKSVDTEKEWTSNKFDLLEDKRRLNVAITRTKHKLIFVGDWATLQKYTTFMKIKDILEENAINLSSIENFQWMDILNSVNV